MKKAVKPKKVKSQPVRFRIGRERPTPIQMYSDIIEWVYRNDGAFSSKNEYRKAFCRMLKNVLGLEDVKKYRFGYDGWHALSIDLGDDDAEIHGGGSGL